MLLVLAMFETRVIPEARPLRLLRRATVVLVIAFLCIGAISSYRAWVQVQYLELRSSESTLHSGSVVETVVVNSARTTIAVRLELIQGAHAETLDMLELRGNELAFFDPRAKSATQQVVLNANHLAGFQPGEALLRATATGRPQWGRTPPPVVREMKVQITHNKLLSHIPRRGCNILLALKPLIHPHL